MQDGVVVSLSWKRQRRTAAASNLLAKDTQEGQALWCELVNAKLAVAFGISRRALKRALKT